MAANDSRLFTPLKVGRLDLAHRIVLAPMTRFRSDEAQVPLPFVKEYYQQRGSTPGTLLITEGTLISARAGVYACAPGIYSPAQVDAWKEITAAVHEKGSYIFLQLWALGRTATPELTKAAGYDVVSSSAKRLEEANYAGSEYATPRALSEEEIQLHINDYVQAAKAAVEVAGFDGVEIHAANGYLIDQFTQDTVNMRTDRWGGSVENRARFALEITKAVVAAVGADRTAIRFSPYSVFQGMRMKNSELVAQFTYLAQQLAAFKLAYVHLVEPRICGYYDIDNPDNHDVSLRFFVDAYGEASPVIVAGGYTAQTAREALEVTHKDRPVLIAFGRQFISNPDLPFRFKEGIELTANVRNKTYAPMTKEGYIDYPFSDEFTRSLEAVA
ncbi:Chanoclavine-I aldehyde reductase [Talaromyces atroroseus]|uniref:Chanoclavine-I aldehyde reductase n=1 Tax=Talaromyces atroroseus TaxID=1441469 RepID=A0A225AEY1_TALAT|nr:Chanoclavine-I aldehyde reductase [Talaromyces atroroseus]OKL56594.1 Chanoclavine-I aldehyde reductase [Talaromyces atroroseus]